MSFVETPQQPSEIGSEHFRSQVGHIGRHAGAFFAGTLFTAALSYAFKIYLARVLGAENLGLYALGLTIIGFFGIFNALGLGQAAVRFVPTYMAASNFQKLHALLWKAPAVLLAANVLFGASLLLAGRWIAIRFYHAPALVQYLPLFALIMLAGVLNDFFGKVLTGYLEVRRRTLIVNFMGTPVTMLLAIALLSMGYRLAGYLIAQIVGAAVVCLLLLRAVRQRTPAAARISAQRGSSLGKDIWSFSGSMLGIVFMEFAISHTDKVALGYFRGAREVGIYSVAAALVAYVPVLLGSVNQVFSPTIADLHTRNQHSLLDRLFQSLTKWILAVTIPLATVLIIFARPLMGLFGQDFERGWPVLVIGTFGQLVNCGVGSVGYLLLMTGNEKRLIRVQAAMAAVMILSAIALIPWLGVVGAAIAAAVTNIGMNVLNLLQVRKGLHLSPYNRSYLRLLPPTAAGVIVTLLLKQYAVVFHHNWLAILVAMIAVYLLFGATLLITGLNQDDRMIAQAVWSRVRKGSSAIEVF